MLKVSPHGPVPPLAVTDTVRHCLLRTRHYQPELAAAANALGTSALAALGLDPTFYPALELCPATRAQLLQILAKL